MSDLKSKWPKDDDFGAGFGFRLVRADDLTQAQIDGLEVDAGKTLEGVHSVEGYQEPLGGTPEQPEVTQDMLVGYRDQDVPDFRHGVASPYVITNE